MTIPNSSFLPQIDEYLDTTFHISTLPSSSTLADLCGHHSPLRASAPNGLMSSFQSQDASNDIPTAPSTSGSLILQNEMLCDNLADTPVACKRLGVLGGSAHQQAPATCYLQGVADGGSGGPTDFQFVSGYKPVGQTHPNQMFPKVEYVRCPLALLYMQA